MMDQTHMSAADATAYTNLATRANTDAYRTLAMDPSWIDQDVFREMQNNADDDRETFYGNDTTEMRLDGLYYTNNGMIFMGRKRESGDGKLEFNGSVVAADTGILSPRNLDLFYDVRTRNYLNIEDNTQVDFFVVLEREGR